MGLMMPASVPAVCYEVVPTARRGQTYGKRCMEIRVVPWNGGGDSFGSRPHLSGTACMVRWAIPHGAGLLAAVVAGVASFRGHTDGRVSWNLCRSRACGVAAGVRVIAVGHQRARLARQGRGHGRRVGIGCRVGDGLATSVTILPVPAFLAGRALSHTQDDALWGGDGDDTLIGGPRALPDRRGDPRRRALRELPWWRAEGSATPCREARPAW